ncbi:hypothetical protein C6500_11435 [Candidatus Poribacteria bacterium]|nr:MAG: hypothetical protein C6500_11435 [Candidatus Poribacteria bacterium]
MSHFDYKPFYRRNLPHIQPSGATLFVTFHLAGSLPQRILEQWKAEKSRLLKSQNDSHFVASKRIAFGQKQEHHEWRRQWFQKFEKTLDNAQNGPLWLKDERVAEQIAESLHYRDGKVYRLDAYCIMANHVHIVFAPLPIEPSETNTVDSHDNTAQTNSLCYNTLSSIMQSLKGYTARKANPLLERSGAFWHHESYDHVVRNASEWRRIITYVLNNPVKAGLVDKWEKWRWSYYRQGFLP